MYHRQEATESDELRARFTAWMNILLYRARLKFIRKEKRRIPTISLDELEEEGVIVADSDVFRNQFKREEKSFDFEGIDPTLIFIIFPIEDIDALRGDEGFYAGLR